MGPGSHGIPRRHGLQRALINWFEPAALTILFELATLEVMPHALPATFPPARTLPLPGPHPFLVEWGTPH